MVDIPANATMDAAGNGNIAADQFSVIADLTEPRADIEGPDGPVNSAFDITVTFSEPVQGFEAEDLEVVNGTAGNLRGSEADYMVTITLAPTRGPVTVTLADCFDIRSGECLVTDLAGNGNQGATFTVTTVAAGVTPSQMMLSIAEGEMGTYTLTLNRQPSTEVTVTPSSSDQGVATVSGPLTFNSSNWDQPQMVTVTGVSDGIIHGGDRSTTITHSTTSSDSNYGGLISMGEVAVTVTDTAWLALSLTTLTVTEGEEMTYTVRLNRSPTNRVVVTPVSSDQTVVTVLPVELTFTPSNWQTPQTVTVTGVDNDIDDREDRTATINHTTASADPSHHGLSGDQVMAIVTDDDIAGVTVSETDLTVAEGGTASYRVRLNTSPTGRVTVRPRSSDQMVATVLPVELTFTPNNWQTPQSLTVRTMDNAIVDQEDHRATISHNISGYGSVSVPNVTVTVTDDDEEDINGPMISMMRDINRSTTNRALFTLRARPAPTSDLDVAVRINLSKKVRSQSLGGMPNPGAVGMLTASVGGLGVAAQTSPQLVHEGDNTVTIPAGQSSVDLMVEDVDGRKVTMVMVMGAGYSLEGDAEVSLEPNVAVSANAARVSENGGMGSYTLALTLRPTGEVTVVPMSSDRTVATVSGPLTFNANNWNQPQTVTVTGVNDAIDNDPDRTTQVTHRVSGGRYDDVVIDLVRVTVVDDEVVAIAIRALEPSVMEGVPVQFQLTAIPTPMADLVVAIAVADPDGILTDTAPTEVTIPANQSTFLFELATDDDEVDELDATVAVTLEEVPDADYAVAAAPNNTASITVMDNDGLTRERRERGIEHALGAFGRAAGWDLVETIRSRSRNSAVQVKAFEITNLPTFGVINMGATGSSIKLSSIDLSELLDSEIRVAFSPQAAQASPSELSGKSPLVRAWIKASRTDVDSNPLEGWTQEGEVIIGRFGIDAAYASGWLVGSVFSWNDGNIEFEDTDTNGGVGIDLLSINPYVSFTKGKLHLWGTIGGGIGDMSYEDSPTGAATSTSSDLRMLKAAAGAEYAFGRLGPFDLKGRGEGMIVDMDADGSSDPLVGYDEVGATVYGTRGEFELGLPLNFDDNRTELRPYVFTGLRQDGGLGNDLVMEYGGGFALRTRSLVAEGTIRSQTGREDDAVSLKGYSISLAYDRGNDRKGLVAGFEQSAGPSSDYDPYGGGALSSFSPRGAGTETRLHLGYGIGWDEQLLRPFVEMDWQESQQSDLDLGLEYQYSNGSASLGYSGGELSLRFRFRKLF